MNEFTQYQLEYILQWLNSWEQLKGSVIPLRFKEVFMNKNKCNVKVGCHYTRSMTAPRPRLCLFCNHPEESAMDHESIKISKIGLVSLDSIGKVIQLLQLRNEYVQRSIDFPGSIVLTDEMRQTNENIKQLLNL